MKNMDKIWEILHKLEKLSIEERQNEVEKYPIEILDLLASKVYKDYDCADYSKKLDNDFILDNILYARFRKLNNYFEWTGENKQRFLKINNLFFQKCEKANKEALSIASELEERINNKDEFLKDYDIDIEINAYINDKYYGNDDDNDIGYVLSEPYNHKISWGLTHDHYKYYLKKEAPIYLDKTLNWNTRNVFGDTFKDDYICYVISQLLDIGWSFFDIIGIDTIYADVNVKYQHYIKKI